MLPFLVLRFIDLFERQSLRMRERERVNESPKSMARAGPNRSQETRFSSRHPAWEQEPSTCAIFHCFLRSISKELNQKRIIIGLPAADSLCTVNTRLWYSGKAVSYVPCASSAMQTPFAPSARGCRIPVGYLPCASGSSSAKQAQQYLPLGYYGAQSQRYALYTCYYPCHASA